MRYTLFLTKILSKETEIYMTQILELSADEQGMVYHKYIMHRLIQQLTLIYLLLQLLFY